MKNKLTMLILYFVQECVHIMGWCYDTRESHCAWSARERKERLRLNLVSNWTSSFRMAVVYNSITTSRTQRQCCSNESDKCQSWRPFGALFA